MDPATLEKCLLIGILTHFQTTVILDSHRAPTPTLVVFNGSPRADGNTRLLLEAVLESLAQAGWETDLLQVGR